MARLKNFHVQQGSTITSTINSWFNLGDPQAMSTTMVDGARVHCPPLRTVLMKLSYQFNRNASLPVSGSKAGRSVLPLCDHGDVPCSLLTLWVNSVIAMDKQLETWVFLTAYWDGKTRWLESLSVICAIAFLKPSRLRKHVVFWGCHITK